MNFPEVARGLIADMKLRLVEPGPWPSYLPNAEWHGDTCMGENRQGKVMMMVLLRARIPGQGAFRRLVGRLRQDGWRVVVVLPTGEMPAICRHMGFKPERIDLIDVDLMVLD